MSILLLPRCVALFIVKYSTVVIYFVKIYTLVMLKTNGYTFFGKIYTFK